MKNAISDDQYGNPEDNYVDLIGYAALGAELTTRGKAPHEVILGKG